ncbi:hypothetical protein BH11PAT1_BH11PAT1_4580 [soil metagenome]
MKICFFGAYDRTFTSNKIVLKGLEQSGVTVVEVCSHVKVTRLNTPGDMSIGKLILRIVKKYKIFSEIIKHFGDLRSCDAIYVGYPGHFDVLMAYPLAKIFRKKLIFNPLVIFYTGFVADQGILREDTMLAKLIKSGEKLLYYACDIVLADTPYQKDHLVEEFGVNPEKIKILPIGADDEIYQYSPRKNKTSKIQVVYYGLYSPLHGVEYIVDAAEILRNNTEITFVMVGKGNTYEKTVEHAKNLNLSTIKFYPEVTEENCFELLASADIFVGFLQKHPTVERAIPNKVYQGLALGKAVLTADAAVIRSTFTNKKNIYVCKPANAASFAEAVLDLQKNTMLRNDIAENGYQLFLKDFTPKSVGQQLKKYVQEIII